MNYDPVAKAAELGMSVSDYNLMMAFAGNLWGFAFFFIGSLIIIGVASTR